MKRSIDITYSNNIRIRLVRAKDSNMIRIVIYANGSHVIKGPYLPPELALEKALNISKSDSIELFIKDNF